MKLFSAAQLDELAARAAASPRRRMNFNIHASAEDAVQRFFISANTDSYFRPHRHTTKSELALVLRGSFDVLVFDDTGHVVERHSIGDGTGNFGFETPSNTWHTLIARADGSAFFEVKQGPYDPKIAAEFAPWAPAEGDAAAAGYLGWIRTAMVGDRNPSLE